MGKCWVKTHSFLLVRAAAINEVFFFSHAAIRTLNAQKSSLPQKNLSGVYFIVILNLAVNQGASDIIYIHKIK